jgi:hypothetical protein
VATPYARGRRAVAGVVVVVAAARWAWPARSRTGGSGGASQGVHGRGGPVAGRGLWRTIIADVLSGKSYARPVRRVGEVVELSKGVRIVGDARDALALRLCSEYEKGASIRDLAEHTGRSYGWVHGVLTEAGVTRARGGRRTGKKTSPAAQQLRP